MLQRFPVLLALGLAACAPSSSPADSPGESDGDGVSETRGALPNQAARQELDPAASQATPPPHLTVSPASLTAVDTTAQPGAGLFDYVGVYHGGEAPASDGERWLGLYPAPTGWELKPVTIRARAAPDPVMWTSLGPEDPPTGVEITTEHTTRRPWGSDDEMVDDPSRLFVRAEALAPGPVTIAFAGGWALTPGASLGVSLPGGHGASLEVKHVAGRPRESALTLDGTPIVHLHDRDAGHPTLFWAGDLDRDGELDLVLDASPHYNATALQLWLSSAAAEGMPLGLVAEHWATGC